MNPKKQAILENVLDLLHQHTEETFTMANLARHLDMAKSTLYEYFETKQDMIAQALMYLIDQNTQTLLVPEDALLGSFEARVRGYYDRLMTLTKEKRTMSSVMYHPEVGALSEPLKFTIHKKVQEAYRLSEARLHSLLAQGHKEGVLKRRLEGGSLHAVEALFFGSVIALTDPFNQWDAQTMVNDIIEALIKLHI